MTFVLNKDALKKYNMDPDAVLEPMREYAAKNEIKEVSYGCFERNDKHGLALLTKYLFDQCDKDATFLNYFDSFILDVDGRKQDGKSSLLKYCNKWNINTQLV